MEKVRECMCSAISDCSAPRLISACPDTETYRVETMKAGRTGCKGDPRFQDSSTSEEEEDAAEETDLRQPVPE